MFDTLFKDLNFAARMLRKKPGFAIVAVLALGLGIGANTAIFSIIDALFLKPLPVQQPDRLVMVGGQIDSPGISYTFYKPQFEKFRDLSTVFSNVAAVGGINRSNLTINGTGGGPDPGQVQVGLVSGNYFSLLGVNTAIGRMFTADDDRVPGDHPVAVISYDYWFRRFALASDTIGRTLTLNGTTFKVLGVTPRGFTGESVGNPVDLWVPLMMQREVMPEVPDMTRFPMWVIARLKPGMTMNQAEAASQVVYQQLLHDAVGPKPTPQQIQQMARARLVLQSAERGYSPQRETFSQPLTILMSGVGLLLLIVCANVANLLLARATVRQREVSMRRALGASRIRIVRQLLTESLLLAVLGGVLGVLVAVWVTGFLAALAGSPVVFPFTQGAVFSLDLHLSGRVLLFVAALSLLTVILFGLAPAFRGSQVTLSVDLNERSLAGTGRRRPFSLGRMLVVAQVAFSLLLLATGGLLLRTLFNLEEQDLGFDREHLLLVWSMPGQTGRAGPALTTFWHTVQERLSSIPGVVSASALNGGVLNGIIQTAGRPTDQMTVVGQPPKPTEVPGGRNFVSPRFFETMGIPLIAGREIAETDTAAAPVVVINETMSRFYFGSANPVGQAVRFPWQRPADPPTTIVGVVKDYIKGTPRGASQPQFSTFFSYRDSEAESRLWTMCIVVKTSSNPIAAADFVRKELRSLDPNLPILKIDTIEQQLRDVLAQDRMMATLSGCFGLFAVLLACLGLYGVISYSVAGRTSEIGVRLAMGASPGNVSRLVLRESMLPVLSGIVVGIPLVLATTRLMASRFFGITSTDLPTIGISIIVILSVAGIAALLPARAASKVDPMHALRYD